VKTASTWQTRQYRKMHKLNITENSKQGKNSKRKLPVPWFSRLLWHSARKPDGLILQCNRDRTGLYNQKKQFVWGTVLLHLLLYFSLRYIILVSCYNITVAVVVICNTFVTWNLMFELRVPVVMYWYYVTPATCRAEEWMYAYWIFFETQAVNHTCT